jgi:hypothetical protein
VKEREGPFLATGARGVVRGNRESSKRVLSKFRRSGRDEEPKNKRETKKKNLKDEEGPRTKEKKNAWRWKALQILPSLVRFLLPMPVSYITVMPSCWKLALLQTAATY